MSDYPAGSYDILTADGRTVPFVTDGNGTVKIGVTAAPAPTFTPRWVLARETQNPLNFVGSDGHATFTFPGLFVAEAGKSYLPTVYMRVEYEPQTAPGTAIFSAEVYVGQGDFDSFLSTGTQYELNGDALTHRFVVPESGSPYDWWNVSALMSVLKADDLVDAGFDLALPIKTQILAIIENGEPTDAVRVQHQQGFVELAPAYLTV